jgi:hypothetical protein
MHDNVAHLLIRFLDEVIRPIRDGNANGDGDGARDDLQEFDLEVLR